MAQISGSSGKDRDQSSNNTHISLKMGTKVIWDITGSTLYSIAEKQWGMMPARQQEHRRATLTAF